MTAASSGNEPSLTILPLGPRHERTAFSCGVESLDRYLKTQAEQDMRRRFTSVFACSEKGADAILGYRTSSSLSIDRAKGAGRRVGRRGPRLAPARPATRRPTEKRRRAMAFVFSARNR